MGGLPVTSTKWQVEFLSLKKKLFKIQVKLWSPLNNPMLYTAKGSHLRQTMLRSKKLSEIHSNQGEIEVTVHLSTASSEDSNFKQPLTWTK